jgi:hypothetical protein
MCAYTKRNKNIKDKKEGGRQWGKTMWEDKWGTK